MQRRSQACKIATSSPRLALLSPNPNTRKAAELEIRKLEHQEGMLSSAFQLVGMDSADLAVRQAAAM